MRGLPGVAAPRLLLRQARGVRGSSAAVAACPPGSRGVLNVRTGWLTCVVDVEVVVGAEVLAGAIGGGRRPRARARLGLAVQQTDAAREGAEREARAALKAGPDRSHCSTGSIVACHIRGDSCTSSMVPPTSMYPLIESCGTKKLMGTSVNGGLSR